jgi:hypothetical protein
MTLSTIPTLSPSTRFAIATAVAEDLYGGDWVAHTLPAKCAPAVATLYRLDDHTAPTLTLGQDEQRLYIAKARSRGQVPDESLTEVFEEIAQRLFPELSPEPEPMVLVAAA